MKIPKSIKILGHEVQILNHYRFREQTDCEGLSDTNTNTIWLSDTVNDETIPESRRAEILLHEIMHFVNHFCNTEIPEDKHTLQSVVLFQVLRDNKLNFYDTTDARKK